LVEPAQDEPGHRLDGAVVVQRSSGQLVGEVAHVSGDALGDVLGETEHQGLAGAEVSRAAALRESCLPVDGPVRETAQTLLGDDRQRRAEQELHPRAAGRRLLGDGAGHDASSSTGRVTHETTRRFARGGSATYVLLT